MELDDQPLAKKPRLKSVNLPVSECVREFQLPRQYPSTATELGLSKYAGIKYLQGDSIQHTTSKNFPLPGKMKFIPNKDFKKLKIRLGKDLRDGRDFGEVKLKVVPGHEEKLKARIVSGPKLVNHTEKGHWSPKVVCTKPSSPEKAIIHKNKIKPSVPDPDTAEETNESDLSKYTIQFLDEARPSSRKMSPQLEKSTSASINTPQSGKSLDKPKIIQNVILSESYLS